MLCKMKRTRPKFFFPFFARFSFQDEGSFKIKKDYETRFERMERHCAGWRGVERYVVMYICKSMSPPWKKKLISRSIVNEKT